MSLRFGIARVGGATAGAIHARGAWSRRDGLLFGLFDADALLGVGEASPLPGFGAPCDNTAAQAPRGAPLGVNDASPDGDSLLQAERELQQLVAPTRVLDTVTAIADFVDRCALQSPSARFALETALLDAAARRAGCALGDLLGARRSAERSVLVGHLGDLHAQGQGVGTPSAAATLLDAAQGAVARGARCLKFKVSGKDPAAETAALIQLRRALASPIRVRLDLNGSLSADAAREALKHYAKAEVEFVEEPTQGATLLELGPCAVPWFADESLATPALQTALLERSAASGIVLKPTLLGGLTLCLTLAKRAARANKHVLVTHAFEGPVALAACAELALTITPGQCAAHGLDRHAALSAYPAADIPQLADAAGTDLHVQAAVVQGHGVQLPSRVWTE